MWLILGAHDLGKQSEPLNMHVENNNKPRFCLSPSGVQRLLSFTA